VLHFSVRWLLSFLSRRLKSLYDGVVTWKSSYVDYVDALLRFSR
ncbi:2765_t:CDS:1, partial [Gigaspora rosea]